MVLGISLALVTPAAWSQGTFTGPIINATTGYQNNGGAPSGYLLGGNGTTFVSAAPGLQSSINSPVSATYTIQCPSTTSGTQDSGTLIEFATGAGTVNLPASSGNVGCVFSGVVDTGVTITLTPNGSDKIAVWTGSSYTPAANANYSINGPTNFTINNGISGQWYVRVLGSNTVGVNSPFGSGSSSIYSTRLAQGYVTPTGDTASASMSGTTATFSASGFSFNTTGLVAGTSVIRLTGCSVSSYNGINWTISTLTSSSITATASGTSGLSSATGCVINANNQYLTSTTGTLITLPPTSTGATNALEVNLPSGGGNFGFDCDISFSTITNSGTIEFYLQDSVTPTQYSAGAIGVLSGGLGVSGTAYSQNNAFANTSANAIWQGTTLSSGTTVGELHLHGGIEQPSGGLPTFQLLTSISTGSMTITRNSNCQWYQQAY